MSKLKKICKNIIVRIWKRKYIKKDNDVQYFFCPSGIGDTLYVLAYMKEYRKAFPNKKIVFVVKEAHKFLVDMYPEDVDETIVVSRFYFKLVEQYLKEHLKNEEKIIYAHPLKIIYDPCKILGVRDICLLDLYKVLLDIPINSEYCKPTINFKKTSDLKRQNAINHNSILLCPYCVSIPMIDKKIWEDIAKEYTDKGYKVFTNIKDESEEAINGTVPISLELNDFCSIIEEFKYVYAIRSGLCDLMSFFNVDLTVLYPVDKQTGDSSSFNQYNFKNIGIRNDIHEIIVKGKKDDLLKEILEKNK